MSTRPTIRQRFATPAAAALQACIDYDFWAAEAARLTDEIAVIECPQEDRDEAVGDSCFRQAKRLTADGDWRGSRPLRLEEIAELSTVRVCPECSRLVRLIRSRRHARQKLGQAKRAVRRVGRRALQPTP